MPESGSHPRTKSNSQAPSPKTLKLFVFPGRTITWVSKRGLMCVDLVITLFNSGSRFGIIDNMQLEIENSNSRLILKPIKIKKLDKDGSFIDDSYWNTLILAGKSEIFKIISFTSDVDIQNIENGNFNSTLNIFYKKKPEKKQICLINKTFDISIDKEVAINNSPGYQQRRIKKTNKKNE